MTGRATEKINDSSLTYCATHFEWLSPELLITVKIRLCYTTVMEGESCSDDFITEIECSDDEKYEIKLRDNGEWEPEPSVIMELFSRLESEGFIELEWQCPGRRPPTPQSSNDNKDSSDKKTNEVKEEEDKSDFEFKDEMSQLRLSVRPAENVGPRGSAKKKTTSLDAILSNMARHRKLDMMEQD